MTLPGILASGGLAPVAPTIGTATDGGNGTSVIVAFTAPSWVGKGTGTVTYTAISSPGGLTGTSTSSPITVSGLTAGTAYTFTVTATTSYGVTGPASAASNSVTPVTPAPGKFDSIATVNGTGSSSTISITGIPSTYRHLQVRIVGAVTNIQNSPVQLLFRCNNNAGNLYSRQLLQGETTIGVSATVLVNSGEIGVLSGSQDANNVALTIVDIPDYSNTNFPKTFRCYSGHASPDTTQLIEFGGGLFGSSDAINRLDFITGTGSFSTRTQISLYGMINS